MLNIEKLQDDLRKYKHDNNLRFQDVADNAGIDRQTIGGLMNNRTIKGFQATTFVKLCKVMGKDLNDYVL